MNRVDFVVKCRMYPANKETFCIDYVRHDGNWLPIQPLVCDNGCGSDTCQQCVADVMAKALATEPAFPK